MSARPVVRSGTASSANNRQASVALLALALASGAAISCTSPQHSGASDVQASTPASTPAPAPPASQTGGFDGQRAWDHLEKLVGFGPRPPASDNIHRAQQYIVSQLQSFGCPVKQDDFHAQTPVGTVGMKNIIAESKGDNSGIVLLLSHYDTLRLPNFVGADDGGSSSAVLLEMARLVCARHQRLTVWMAFVDGEEDQNSFQTAQQAQTTWSDDDSTYGSRELAAQMSLSGDLKRVKALVLLDMIGDANLDITRDSNSTPWLTDLVWSIAKRLGYTQYFLNRTMAVDDDHMPFVRRGVPSLDLIDFDYPPWHTAGDTLDKCSPHSLAVTGHVLVETLGALDRKFAPDARAGQPPK